MGQSYFVLCQESFGSYYFLRWRYKLNGLFLENYLLKGKNKMKSKMIPIYFGILLNVQECDYV
jgi:hypothetical protein